MNKLKRLAIAASTAAILFGTLATSAFAAAPVQPNCLGTDVSGFTKTLKPLGQIVVKPLSSGGFDEEILGHLQGVPPISSCQDSGFPTPLH